MSENSIKKQVQRWVKEGRGQGAHYGKASIFERKDI
jgi:hypothetical protein